MKEITLNNIMATEGKGYFAATLGNCTWQYSSIVPKDGSTQSARVIPSASGEVTLTSAKHNLIASHKYYVTFKIKFESQVSGTVDWYWPVAEPPAINHMIVSGDADTWIKCSAVFDRTQFSDGGYSCRFDYNNESTNVAFRFTSCMLFDLTEAFGKGKEPSKEWMDAHVTSFAETQTVHYYETLKELFNNIANAIRNKTKKTDKIFACDFPDSINAIEAGTSDTAGADLLIISEEYLFDSVYEQDQSKTVTFPIDTSLIHDYWGELRTYIRTKVNPGDWLYDSTIVFFFNNVSTDKNERVYISDGSKNDGNGIMLNSLGSDAILKVTVPAKGDDESRTLTFQTIFPLEGPDGGCDYLLKLFIYSNDK